MPHDNAARLETVACPICGRPLKWTPDRWLAAFECERCGEFSDFGGRATASEASRARFGDRHIDRRES